MLRFNPLLAYPPRQRRFHRDPSHNSGAGGRGVQLGKLTFLSRCGPNSEGGGRGLVLKKIPVPFSSHIALAIASLILGAAEYGNHPRESISP